MKLNICRLGLIGANLLLIAGVFAGDPCMDSALGRPSRPRIDWPTDFVVSAKVLGEPVGSEPKPARFVFSGSVRVTELTAQATRNSTDPAVGWANVVGLRQRNFEGLRRNEWSLNVGPEFEISDWVDGRLALAVVLASVLAVIVVRRKRREAREVLAAAALERARLRACVDYAHR